MLNMFNFEQLVAQTIQLAQTGNKLHGNKLHVWTGLNVYLQKIDNVRCQALVTFTQAAVKNMTAERETGRTITCRIVILTAFITGSINFKETLLIPALSIQRRDLCD